METSSEKDAQTCLVMLQYFVPIVKKTAKKEYKTRTLSLVRVADTMLLAFDQVPDIFRKLIYLFESQDQLIYEEMVMRTF